jgi:thioredoxin 2
MEHIIAACNNCGQKNRIPVSRQNDRPVCGKCRTPLTIENQVTQPVIVTDQNFNQEIDSHKGAVLLDCWAPWCGPCRMMTPVLEELAGNYAGRAKIAKLNVDENPATASRFFVQSVPTILLFKNGQLINTLVGALSRTEIEKHLNGLI